MELHMKANYHTHTTWCDGKDSPRAVIESAIAKGFDAIGFSSHSMLPGRYLEWALTPEKGASLRGGDSRTCRRIRFAH